jgi:hypothetical protein
VYSHRTLLLLLLLLQPLALAVVLLVQSNKLQFVETQHTVAASGAVYAVTTTLTLLLVLMHQLCQRMLTAVVLAAVVN